MRNRTQFVDVNLLPKIYFRSMGLGHEYQIRLHKDDGEVSIIMKVHAYTDEGAKREACHMMNDRVVRADVYREHEFVGEVRHLK